MKRNCSLTRLLAIVVILTALVSLVMAVALHFREERVRWK